MKRTIILLLAASALTAAYLTGHSQQPAPPQVVRPTRIAIVDLGRVYTAYDEVKRLKAQLDGEMEPYLQQKRSLEQTVLEWTAIAMSTDEDYSPETKEMAGRIVVDAKRQLEDLNLNVKIHMGKKVENMLDGLNEKVNQAVQKYSADHGYDLVLCHGEPQQKPLSPTADGRRKLAVVDKGGMVLMHSRKELDITNDVVSMLNHPRAEAEEE